MSGEGLECEREFYVYYAVMQSGRSGMFELCALQTVTSVGDGGIVTCHFECRDLSDALYVRWVLKCVCECMCACKCVSSSTLVRMSPL